mmetsp:Transcript_25439/g.54182  ORF Transcript_25439/g.54182 Transcript_25439/m.54182 type:complete len:127 (-) Transcript_25439:258-638(-)
MGMLRLGLLHVGVRRWFPVRHLTAPRPAALHSGSISWRGELRASLLLTVVVLRLEVVLVLGLLRTNLLALREGAGRHVLRRLLLLPPLLGCELVAGRIFGQIFRLRRERGGPKVVVVECALGGDAL